MERRLGLARTVAIAAIPTQEPRHPMPMFRVSRIPTELRGFRSIIEVKRNMKFDYGHEVMLRTKNDRGDAIEKKCFVVGITPVENEEQERVFGYPRGTVLYTVE